MGRPRTAYADEICRFAGSGCRRLLCRPNLLGYRVVNSRLGHCHLNSKTCFGSFAGIFKNLEFRESVRNGCARFALAFKSKNDSPIPLVVKSLIHTRSLYVPWTVRTQKHLKSLCGDRTQQSSSPLSPLRFLLEKMLQQAGEPLRMSLVSAGRWTGSVE